MEYVRVTEEITSTYDEFGMRCERDAFDSLLDHAPDKLQMVKQVSSPKSNILRVTILSF